MYEESYEMDIHKIGGNKKCIYNLLTKSHNSQGFSKMRPCKLPRDWCVWTVNRKTKQKHIHIIKLHMPTSNVFVYVMKQAYMSVCLSCIFYFLFALITQTQY